MTISRYSSTPSVVNTQLLEPAHFLSWMIPEKYRGYLPLDFFTDQNYTEHVWQFGDRLDRIASTHYGDDQLWWVIAFANGIEYPLNLKIGTVIRIPSDVNTVLEKLNIF